jgi:hypothetical protein
MLLRRMDNVHKGINIKIDLKRHVSNVYLVKNVEEDPFLGKVQLTLQACDDTILNIVFFSTDMIEVAP